MFVADASVFVSFFLPSDANHVTSNAWLQKVVTNRARLYVPIILPVEVAGSVSRISNSVIDGQVALNNLTNIAVVKIDVPNKRIVMRMANLAATLQLRGMDTFYVELAQRLKIPLVTWDVEQRTKASSVIAAYTPLTVP